MGIRSAYAHRVTVAVSLILAMAAAVAAEPAAPAAEQRFDVMEYRVIGNTVLAGRDIERLLYPLLGTRKTLQDV